MHFNWLTVIVHLESDRKDAVAQTVIQLGALVWLTTPTSLSRLAWTCRGLSDITKSRVASTEGAVPSESGAYWTFLSISFTELLSHTAWSQQIKVWWRSSSLSDSTICELNVNSAHRLRILASWLSALNAQISNSTAHCCRGREKENKRALGDVLAYTAHTLYAATTFSPCQHRVVLAAGPLSKAGCWETGEEKLHSLKLNLQVATLGRNLGHEASAACQ